MSLAISGLSGMSGIVDTDDGAVADGDYVEDDYVDPDYVVGGAALFSSLFQWRNSEILKAASWLLDRLSTAA